MLDTYKKNHLIILYNTCIAALGNILGLPIILLAALGYAAVFASATNTVLAPIFIGAEVFGSQNVIYFAIVCSIAYVFNANQSIYSGQKKFNYFSDLT